MVEPSLDSWTIVFILAAAQGIFLSGIMFVKTKEHPRLLLGMIVLLFSITLIDYVAFWTDYRFVFPHVNRISAAFPFLFGPLFYLYTKLFLGGNKLVRKDWMHLLPFFFYLLLHVPYYILDGATKIDMLVNREFYPFENEMVLNAALFISSIVPIVMTVHLVIYNTLVFRLIEQADLKNVKKKVVRWLNVLRYSFTGFVLSFASYYVMVYIFTYNLSFDYTVSVAMSGFIYCMGYYGYMSPGVLTGSVEEHFEKEKYSNSGLAKEDALKLKGKLIALMEERKIYLKSDLKLSDLADEVDESRHHVSQVINNQLNTTFSAFVNDYRIKESQKLLEDRSQELNMFGIAKESGFNNKTTFSLAFKRHTGLSPSNYKEKKLRQQN